MTRELESARDNHQDAIALLTRNYEQQIDNIKKDYMLMKVCLFDAIVPNFSHCLLNMHVRR